MFTSVLSEILNMKYISINYIILLPTQLHSSIYTAIVLMEYRVQKSIMIWSM